MESPPNAYLVLPEAGEKTLPAIQRKVQMLALRRLLTHPVRDLSAPLRRALTSLRPILTERLKQKPALVLDAIGNPDVLTQLLVLEVGIGDPEQLLRTAIPPLLATLAPRPHHGGLSESVLWELPVSRLVDVRGRRVLDFAPEAESLVADPSGLGAMIEGRSVHLPPPPGAPDDPAVSAFKAFYPLAPELPRLHLSMVDTNPLWANEEHPDKDGNALSLGEKPVEHWVDMIRQALELIRITLPTWYEEFRYTQERLIPVGYMPERHLSATFREAPGIAYITLCESPLTMAEAIIHETQHSKINLLSWIDPIVYNGHTCWTESPVRPDLRPLWGVMLAVHAFVPVATMHQRLAELDHPITHTERFPRRRAEVLSADQRGMRAVLENAEPSPLGKRMIDEMKALLDHAQDAAPPLPSGMDIDPEALPPS